MSKGNKEHNSSVKNMHKKSPKHLKASGRECVGEHMAEILVFTGPGDRSFKISITMSVQESAEGASTAEQTWRPGENLPKHAGFTSLKNNTTKSRESSHHVCILEKVKALSISAESQHKKHKF